MFLRKYEGRDVFLSWSLEQTDQILSPLSVFMMGLFAYNTVLKPLKLNEGLSPNLSQNQNWKRKKLLMQRSYLTLRRTKMDAYCDTRRDLWLEALPRSMGSTMKRRLHQRFDSMPSELFSLWQQDITGKSTKWTLLVPDELQQHFGKYVKILKSLYMA